MGCLGSDRDPHYPPFLQAQLVRGMSKAAANLAPAQSAFHQNLLACVGCCFGEVPELKADAKRAAKLKESGGCCPGSCAGAREGKS